MYKYARNVEETVYALKSNVILAAHSSFHENYCVVDVKPVKFVGLVR